MASAALTLRQVWIVSRSSGRKAVPMCRPCLVSHLRRPPYDYLATLSVLSALATCTAALHLDAARALLPSGLGQDHRKHPILEARLHLLRIHREGQPQRALEGTVRALDEVEVLLVVRALELLLPRMVSTSSSRLMSMSCSVTPGSSAVRRISFSVSDTFMLALTKLLTPRP